MGLSEREAIPQAKIRVGLDGGFATPEVLHFLDCEPKVEYLVNLAANAVLKRKAESAMKRARRDSKISGQTEHVYGEHQYRTRKTSWGTLAAMAPVKLAGLADRPTNPQAPAGEGNQQQNGC